MKNFQYGNPVLIQFGKGAIAKLDQLVPKNAKVMILLGGGSVRKNGVLDQVTDALGDREFFEFSGIEANPDYDTCMGAVAMIRKEGIDFLLATGGGSVIDATKFIAAAACHEGDPWEIVTKKSEVQAALPFGTVLTMAATGSEMNAGSVISRRSMGEKLPFASPLVFPKFSVLDPEATYSVPPRHSACGVVDAYVHVLEQYLSHATHAPLQDRQAEAILSTLLTEGPKVLDTPESYDVRADIMWCACQALNGLINCGVPQDWATHMIGHELTAAFGLAHAESLAVVLPALWRVRKEEKKAKLLQYAKRVLAIPDGDEDAMVDAAIAATEAFFRKLGMKTRLSEYGIDGEKALFIGKKITDRGMKLGENQDMDAPVIEAVLLAAVPAA